MNSFTTIPKFKFWCQKILPLVYDDSLSYMELLCKVIDYLNKVIEDINNIPDYINEIVSEDKLKDILSELLDELREQIARANEGENTTASYDRDVDELVWLNGKLIKMTRAIHAGDRYVEDDGTPDVTGNYVYTSIELELKSLHNELASDINNLTKALNNEINNRENADEELSNRIDNAVRELNETDEELRALVTVKFNNLAEMKAADLTNGDIAITSAYYSNNGSAIYQITNTEPSGYYETLNNGLYAKILNKIVNPYMFGAYGDNSHDDSTALENCFKYNFVYLYGTFKITRRIPIANNITIKGVNSSIIFDTTNITSDGNSHACIYSTAKVIITGVTFESTMTYASNKCMGGIDCYNSDLIVDDCTFKHLEYGILCDNAELFSVKNSKFIGIWEETSDGAFPLNYGYGLVANQCTNVYIENNIIGTKGSNNFVERHAIYVSKHHNESEPTACKYVFIKNNTIYVKPDNHYSGYEFAVKLISSLYTYIEDNYIEGGVGSIFIDKYEVRTIETVIQSNTLICNAKNDFCISHASSSYGSSESKILYGYLLKVKDNYVRLNGSFASFIGGLHAGFYDVIVENNYVQNDYVYNIAQECGIFVLKGETSIQSNNYKLSNNIIRGFKEIFRGGNVLSLITDDYANLVGDGGNTPNYFTFTSAINYKKLKIHSYNNEVLNIKATDKYISGLSYYDNELSMNITCIDDNGTYINDNAEKVVWNNVADRPTVYTNNYKGFERANNLLLYWNGYKWDVTYTVLPLVGTTSEILALNPGNYGFPIYNVTDHKPYWYDAYHQVWKDSQGTVLS